MWATLDEELETGPTSQYAIAAYKLLILTGCRLGEIQKMQWSHVKGNRIEFPDTKTGYKRLPFNAEAIRVLHSIPRQLGNDYVISGENQELILSIYKSLGDEFERKQNLMMLEFTTYATHSRHTQL